MNYGWLGPNPKSRVRRNHAPAMRGGTMANLEKDIVNAGYKELLKKNHPDMFPLPVSKKAA